MLGHVATSVGAALPAVARKANRTMYAQITGTSWTAPVDCLVTIRQLGGGGGGGNYNNGLARSGGGGAFLQKTLRMKKGQQVTGISVGLGGIRATATNANGNPGGDTVCTLPDSTVLRAGGGRGGTSVASSGSGGLASGGDVNNAGGVGDIENTRAATNGAGTFGGLAGVSTTKGYNGGGAGGPNDYYLRSVGNGGEFQGISNSRQPTFGGGGISGDGANGFQQNGAPGFFELEFIPE